MFGPVHVNETMTHYRPRGYFLIHVGGYRPRQRFAFHALIDRETKEQYSVPDRIMPREIHGPDSTEWADEGWTVGDNSRDRFCKWNGPKAPKQFHDFDEAVGFINGLQVRRKGSGEAYALVYMVPGINGREQLHIVGLLDEVIAIDKAIDVEVDRHNAAKEAQKAALREEYPEMDLLRERYGPRVGFELAGLLKQLRAGADVKSLQMPTATFYRKRKLLMEAGLLLPE